MRIKLVLSLLVVFLFCFESYAEAQGRRGGGAGVSRTALAQIEQIQTELEVTDEQKTSLAEMRSAGRGDRGQRGGGDAKGGEGRGKRGEGDAKGGEGRGKRGEGDAKGGEGRGKGGEGRGKRGEGDAKGGRGGQTLEHAQAEIEKLSAVLLEHQVTRLNEIYVQALGQRAIQDPFVADALEITEEQKTQMQDLQTDMREEMMSLRDTVEREEMREKMTEMMESLNKKTMGVLTDSQNKKLEEMKGDEFEIPEDARRQRGGRRGGGQGQGKGGGDRSDF